MHFTFNNKSEICAFKKEWIEFILGELNIFSKMTETN